MRSQFFTIFKRPSHRYFYNNTIIKRYFQNNTKNDKNKNLALYLVAGIVSMVGLSYAAVPLYRLFCQVTGFGGTTQKGMENHFPLLFTPHKIS